MKRFKGVIAPIITPFKSNGDFYELGMLNLLDFLYEHKVDGVYALGSYGSFPLLSISERKNVAEFIIQETKKRNLSSIIQIGAASTLDTIDLALHAASHKPDAIASVVPFYYSHKVYGEETYINHFKEIIKAVNGRVPVQIYNNPRTTGYMVTPKFFASLIDIGVSGMKDSGTDMAAFGEFMNIVNDKSPDFDLMPGSASVFSSGFLLGAEACVAGTAMVFPDMVVDLYDALSNGDLEKIRELQLNIIKVRGYQSIKPLRPSVSYDLLEIKGIDVGVPRKPWYQLNKKEYSDLKRNLQNSGLI
jgi:dihydrodipicolinate synthase/N-acetylneuraminate lyase